jgi:hypothetical protein
VGNLGGIEYSRGLLTGGGGRGEGRQVGSCYSATDWVSWGQVNTVAGEGREAGQNRSRHVSLKNIE